MRFLEVMKSAPEVDEWPKLVARDDLQKSSDVRELFLPSTSQEVRLRDDWKGVFLKKRYSKNVAEWYVECAFAAVVTLRECVDIDSRRRGGVPVLKGTGFTISQTLVELADSSGVEEISDSFDLDADVIRKVLNGLALLLDKPYDR